MAGNVTLPAFAADRYAAAAPLLLGAGHAAIDRYLLQQQTQHTLLQQSIAGARYMQAVLIMDSLQCFDTVGWAAGRASDM